MFELDFKITSYRTLPPKQRKSKFINWVYLLVHHVYTLSREFLIFRNYAKDQIIWGRSKLAVETLIRERFNNPSINLITQIVEKVEFLVFPPEYNATTPILGTPETAKAVVRTPEG
ncbi:hypothetical protein [Flammeovirga sp. SJP92]|uniref:hypothetical protein n=1 Tax=Flammeovirga sp. SJP92 TaxID=1775430 RepID=UPI0007874407|nr:hypothetical protein [Flammeovirga sp. SJP92]KXX70768.1 hypothetical protein AVL50_07110 [Flammeovirga sp. SJP92]